MSFEKMIVLPLNENNSNNDILKIGLKLSKINAFNDNLEINVNNSFIQNTNILDYINSIKNNENLPHFETFAEYLRKINISKEEIKNESILKYITTPILYTKVSPVAQKLSRQKWIPYE